MMDFAVKTMEHEVNVVGKWHDRLIYWVFVSTECVLLDNIAFVLFNFGIALFIGCFCKRFYLYQLPDTWLKQSDKPFAFKFYFKFMI